MNLKLLFPVLLLTITCHNAGAQFSFNIKRTLVEPDHQIYSSSYSNDGKYIVTTGYDRNILVWNSENGIIYKTLAGLVRRPLAARLSPMNDILFSGGEDMQVTEWDLRTGSVIHIFEGSRGTVKTLDISSDGKLLAASGSDRVIRIWNIINHNLIYELRGHTNDVNVLNFSPDGTMIASAGGDKMVFLWDVSTGSVIRSAPIHKNWIADLEFSPDGKSLATCGFDNKIIISSIPELIPKVTLNGHKDWVQTIDFSNDGKYLLSGGRDQTIILWDAISGKLLCQSEKQGQYVLSVDISPVKQDFISSTYMSENLQTWALSGITNGSIAIGNVTPKLTKVSDDLSGKTHLIELFSPLPSAGKILHNKSNIMLVGRINDSDSINAFLINRDAVAISQTGIFQYNLPLVKGINEVSLLAVTSKGVTDEIKLTIEYNEASAENRTADISTGRYYALLIGINEYQNDEISDLDNPVSDAESLYKVLVDNYTFEQKDVIFLKNPTQSELMITFDELGKKLSMNDNLLIFYAGHGYWDDKGKIGYWFPSDASRKNTVNWFRNSTLRDYIGSIQSKHTLLIADACFSGAIFKTRSAFDTPRSIENLYRLTSRKAMTSGILQEVPDVSQFLKFMVKSLTDNKEKFLPSEVLFSLFKPNVMNNSPNIPQYGVIQNVGDEGGDFIFIRK